MIDIKDEDTLSFTEATTVLPRRRGGKKPAVATIHRWATHGCRGIKLEWISVGGTRCTSRQALQRFCERLTTASAPPAAPMPGTDASHRRAEGELRKAGW